MRKIKYILLSLFLVVTLGVLTSGCAKENSTKKIGSEAIHFQSSITGSKNNSRASGTSWAEDHIGVYMLRGADAMTPTGVLKANRDYFTSGTGLFQPATQSQTLYFPAGDQQVEFVAYYPYQAEIVEYTYAVDVENQSSQENIDLLYSNNGTLYSRTSSVVKLEFQHMLTNIVLNIKNLVADGLDGVKVKIEGMKTKAGFALEDGAITAAEESLGAISMKVAVSGNQAVCKGIVLPVTNLTGGRITIELPTAGRHYVWNIPAGQNYYGKNRYTYNINLKEQTVEVLNPEGTITDWIDNDMGEDIELEPEVGTGGSGTDSDPYSVDYLERHKGESDKWVKGYVMGTINTQQRDGEWMGVFEPPFMDKTNILIASSPSLQKIEHCVAIELSEGKEQQKVLNLLENSTLLGREIMVKGDIMNGQMGTPLSIVGLTNHSVAKEVEGARYFYETCGEGEYIASWAVVNVRKFTDWREGAPVVYGDEYDNIVVKGLSISPAHIYINQNEDTKFKMENLPENKRNITLSIDIAARALGANFDRFKIVCDGVENMEQFKHEFTDRNAFHTLSISIPDNTKNIEFVNNKDSEGLCFGFRIDNIALDGAVE